MYTITYPSPPYNMTKMIIFIVLFTKVLIKKVFKDPLKTGKS